jgi:transcriptional regulator with XRE-family HTH domain
MTEIEKAITGLYNVAGSHKITASQLANEAGISRMTLSNWKHKRNEPTLSAWLLVQQALDRLVARKQQK